MNQGNNKSIQDKFDAALNDEGPEEVLDIDINEELEFDEASSLMKTDSNKALPPDVPSSSSDLELSFSEDIDLSEVRNSASTDEKSELSLNEIPPHEPTETKIKVSSTDQKSESDEIIEDLDLSEDGPPQVPDKSNELDNALVEEFNSQEEFTLGGSDAAETALAPQSEIEEEFDIDAALSESTRIAKIKPLDAGSDSKPSMQFQLPEGINTASSQKKSAETTNANSDGALFVVSGGGEDLVRLQTTLRHLRSEREQMLKDLNAAKTEKKLLEQDNLGFKAEIDELKIELSIVKKRNTDELTDLRYQLRVAEEKKNLVEEKLKLLQREFDRINQKVRVDINQVKQREKELEGKLELMAMDSLTQIQSRDHKILELKRKIDALEFNMENITIQEQKAKEDKMKVEERLMKIVKTLRGSIKLLEDDVDLNHDFLEEIKKI